MSIALTEPELEAVPRQVRADSLAASVVILLVMTVAQRLIGFGRGVLFCRWLEPEQLGEWDVAFGFLNLAAPLAVLGLPGVFGRYVAYFRQRGQFHTFLRRTTVVCAVCSAGAVAWMIVARDWFSQLIFGSTAEANIVVWLALCVATVCVHNFLTSLFIAVRMYRIVTALQFIQSFGFAIVSVALLAWWPAGSISAIIGYTVATILSCFGAIGWLRYLRESEVPETAAVPQSAFWAKLIPFSMWMWVSSLLANLFDIIDRFMIIHHSGMASDVALRQVGSYHSSRIVPLLFVSVAALLASMITPHLSHDWESGRRESVVRRLNMMLKLLMYVLLAFSVGVLFCAPLLFRVAFENKFADGLAILPCTLAYCAWFGTFGVAQNYLWCAERAGLSSLALLLGLLLNVALNWLLLPIYGLEGAVWSTTVANLFSLALVYLFSAKHGMHIDLGTWLLTLAPVSLCLGAWVSSIVLLVLTVLMLASNKVLIPEEKQHLLESLGHVLEKLHRWRTLPVDPAIDGARS